MRCPACGFVTFDFLTTCKQCGKALPRGERSVGMVAKPRAGGMPPPPPAGAETPGTSLEGASAVVEPSAPEAPVETAAPAGPDPIRPVGFWLRSAAFLVDAALVAALAYAGAILVDMAVQIGGLFSSATEIGLAWLNTMATTLFIGLLNVCYFTVLVGWRGQTPGKMLLGLKIIRTGGGEVGYGQALLRWVGQCVGLLVLGLGFLMIAVSRRKQGLHDRLAGTYVIRVLP